MSLRNQPYFPLYVQDYLTDEKLNECSAQSQGVYIKLLCLMHKSKEYGKILLKQKDKQDDNQINNFAVKIVKHLPFTHDIILQSLKELIEEDVLFIESNFLCQKRMIKDNDISIKRSRAGKKGGENTQLKNKFAKAKPQPNSEYEYENDNTSNNINLKEQNQIIKNEIVSGGIWIEEMMKAHSKILTTEDVFHEYFDIFWTEQYSGLILEDSNREMNKIKTHFSNTIKKINQNGPNKKSYAEQLTDKIG